MESRKCPHCPKRVNGYTDEHTEFLLSQHLLSHRKELGIPKYEVDDVDEEGGNENEQDK